MMVLRGTLLLGQILEFVGFFIIILKLRNNVKETLEKMLIIVGTLCCLLVISKIATR